MNPRDNDLEWLASNFPELAYAPADQRIEGELRFCAAFDRNSGQLKLGDTDEHRAIGTFLCDTFKVGLTWATWEKTGGPRSMRSADGASTLQNNTDAPWWTSTFSRTGLAA